MLAAQTMSRSVEYKYHHRHWAVVVPVIGRRPQHAFSKLACLVSARSGCSSIRPGRLSTAWLVSLVVFSCHMVTREVHRSPLRRLVCPAEDHLIFLTVLIISMTFVLSLTQILILLSLHVMLRILLSNAIK